jgi:hypothetical protein
MGTAALPPALARPTTKAAPNASARATMAIAARPRKVSVIRMAPVSRCLGADIAGSW